MFILTVEVFLKNFEQIVVNFKYCGNICCSETWLRPEIDSSILLFPGKKIFRLDKTAPCGKTRGEGVCIFVSKKRPPFTEINLICPALTRDSEILTVNVTKPNTNWLIIRCVYKPPIGTSDLLIEFLKKMYTGISREIWLLGDFNVDNLDRANENRLKYLKKKNGMKQLINVSTRPNLRGGTCIDWIATNTDFVNLSGVLDIIISDHLPVYCVKKKSRKTMYIGQSETYLIIMLMSF